jgi:hypothetical protein
LTEEKVMENKDERYYEMFGRVISFGTENAADFDPAGATAGHFTTLGEKYGKLTTTRGNQQHASAEARQVLIDALRQDIGDITRIARAIGQLEFGFEKLFPAPTSNTPTAVLTAADIIIANLLPQAGDTPAEIAAKTARTAKFAAYELPANFATQLAAHRAQIEAAASDENIQNEDGVQSTEDIHTLIHEGMVEVNFIDAAVRAKYRLNPGKLAAWESASHIERAAKKHVTALGFGNDAVNGIYPQTKSENGHRAYINDNGDWKIIVPSAIAKGYVIVPTAGGPAAYVQRTPSLTDARGPYMPVAPNTAAGGTIS